MADESPEPSTALKMRLLRLASQLDKHDCDLPTLLSELQQTMWVLSASHRLFLVNKHLSAYMKSLLDARYTHLAQFQRRINDFFKDVIKWLLPMIGEGVGALEVLRRLLNDEKDFYDIRYTSYIVEVEAELQHAAEREKEEGDRDPETVSACAEFLKVAHCSTINCFFTYNLNYFGRHGGFTKLLEVIRKKPGVEVVNKVLTIVNQVQQYLYPHVGKPIVQAFIEESMTVVLQASDEDMRNYSKESLRMLTTYLEGLESDIHLSEHGQFIESFELEAGLKFLNSPYLDKRIYGLTCIIHIVERSQREEDGEKRSAKRVIIAAPQQDIEMTSYQPRSRTYQKRRWLSSAELLTWLDDHDLMSIIFGDKSHPELVRRCGELLKFLYRQSRVTREHLDRVWLTALGKHEAERDVTVTLFKEVVPVLKPEDASHFFSRITSLSLSHVDSQVLSLLVSFVKPTIHTKPRESKRLKIKIPAPAPDLNTAICEPEQQVMADSSKPIALGYYAEDMQQEEAEVEPEIETPALDPQAAAALEWLWTWSLAGRGLKKETAAEALKHLQDLLRSSAKQERDKYAQKCLSNIHDNLSALPSIAVLKSIITSFPSYRGANYVEETRAQFISRLDREGHLFHELFCNVIWLKREFAQKLMSVVYPEVASVDDQRTDTQSNVSADSADLQRYSEALTSLHIDPDSDLTYYEEVSRRLEFLKFLYQNCPETLSPKQVYLLWDCFAVNAFAQKEQDEFFKWFSGLVSWWSDEYNVLEDDTVHTIYTELLLRLDSRGFTSAAFECFEQYFIHVNKMHGFLDKIEFDDELEVKEISLLGIDALWEHILQVRSEAVSRQASILLKKLYKGLNANSDGQQDLLARCMGQIRAGAERLRETVDEDAALRVSRALTLLSEFIEEFEGVNDCGPSIHLTIQNTVTGAKEPKMFSMKLPHKMKLNDAREAIANKLTPAKSASDILILHGGKVLDGKKGNRTLKELKVMDTHKLIISDAEDQYGFPTQSHAPDPAPLDATKAEKVSQLKAIFDQREQILIAALKRTYWSVEEAIELLTSDEALAELEKETAPTEAPPKPAPNRSHMSQALSDNRDYFDLLFQILGLGHSMVSAKVWKLLTQIPVNKDLFESLRRLEEGWEELLDQYCYYKLLYSLQIVNSFLENGEGEEEEKRNVWKSRFLSSGGFQRLYQILMTSPTSQVSHDQTHSKCLGFLLNVLKTFLSAALSEQSELVEMVDLPGITGKLVELIEELCEVTGDADSVYVVENALGLFLPIAVYKPEVLEGVYERTGFRNAVVTSLLSPHETLRKSMSATVLSLCSSLRFDSLPSSPVSFFLTTLLSALPTHPTAATDYFDLTAKLINMSFYRNAELLTRLVAFLESREIMENRRLQNQDKALAGVLTLAESLFDKENISDFPTFAESVYWSLFEMPSIANIAEAAVPPKFKHSDTRRRAFSLLLQLSRCSQSVSRFLLSKVHETHCEGDHTRTAFEGGIAVKSPSGFVGLKNLGSTCYMNSLLQQLFCMPDFREGVMRAELVDENLEENVLYQLQVLFAHLQGSEKQYHTASSFTKSLRDVEGQALNVRVQQDVDEFYSLLCDRLETCMKSTTQEKLLRNLLGGTVVNIVESSEAEFPYMSETEEQFMRLSLEIKNKKTLQEALDLFIHADVLEGENKYFCDQYDRKVNATRRALIDNLGNTLIIHLKRFEFDYTSSTRVKINDYCEFPVDISFQPWARERPGRDSAYYQFKLQGVLVHTGVAEAGHYYSLAADRKTGKWFEFNDNVVKEFRIEDLKEECFGGTGVAKTFWGAQSFTKSANAYLLVYERCVKLPYPSDPVPSSVKTFSLYKEIVETVTQENIDFLRDGQYFDQSYHQFLQSFAKGYQFEPQSQYSEWMSAAEDRSVVFYDVQGEEEELSTTTVPEPDEGLLLLQTAVHYAFELMTRAKHTEFFKDWMLVVMSLLQKHTLAALWLLKKMTPGTFQAGNLVPAILLEERQMDTRMLFADMLVQTVLQTLTSELPIFGKYVEAIAQNPVTKVSKRFKRQRAASGRFFQYYVTDLMTEAKRNWRRFREYFTALARMVKGSEQLLKFAVEEDLVDKLIEFFMNGNPPFAMDVKLIMGDQIDSLDMDPVLELLSFLVLQCYTTPMSQRNMKPATVRTPMLLSTISEKHLIDFRVMRTLAIHYRSDYTSLVFSHLSFCNLEYTISILEELLLLFTQNRTKWSYITPLLRILHAVITTPDGLFADRMQLLMTLHVSRSGGQQVANTLFDLLYRVKDTSDMFVALILAWFSDILEREDARAVVTRHRTRVQWVEKYLQDYDPRYLTQSTVEDYKGVNVHLVSALQRLRNLLAMVLVEEVVVKTDSSDDTEEELPPEDAKQEGWK